MFSGHRRVVQNLLVVRRTRRSATSRSMTIFFRYECNRQARQTSSRCPGRDMTRQWHWFLPNDAVMGRAAGGTGRGQGPPPPLPIHRPRGRPVPVSAPTGGETGSVPTDSCPRSRHACAARRPMSVGKSAATTSSEILSRSNRDQTGCVSEHSRNDTNGCFGLRVWSQIRCHIDLAPTHV